MVSLQEENESNETARYSTKKGPSKQYVHRCGGGLITTQVVLTAAHCICHCSEWHENLTGICMNLDCSRWKGYDAVLGDDDVEYRSGEEQIVKVIYGEAHMNYTWGSKYH